MIMRTYETPIGVMVTQLFKLAIVLMKTNANNSYVYGGGVSHTRSDLEPQTTNVKRPTDYVGVRADIAYNKPKARPLARANHHIGYHSMLLNTAR